jgi:transcriptional regulator with XRE-family HTH domain
MDSHELQQLKMAWLAAEERGDRQSQLALLRDHPQARMALVDFIAAYRATAVADDLPLPPEEATLLPLTQRACQRALERVFAASQPAPLPATVTTLRELRRLRQLSLSEAARGLRLGVDVWKKFEDGAIDLLSLTARQLARLAAFFQISPQQFSDLLSNSQPAPALNRRQTGEATRRRRQEAPPKEPFAEAIRKSTMSDEERRAWLEE